MAEELVPQQEEQGGSLWPDEQPAPAPPVAPPAPDPVAINAKVDHLSHLLGMLVTQQQSGRQAPPSQETPPAPPDLSWKPNQFLSKAEAMALLTSQDPAEELNQVFNKVGKSVYEPLVEQLKQRDEMIARMNYEAQYRQATIEQQTRAQQNEAKFYQAHPQLKNFSYLVPMEAQRLAQESMANPTVFIGKTESDIHNLLASRVQERLQSIQASLSGTPESPEVTPQPIQRPAAAPKTFMERGSGVRPGAPAPSRDPNKAALREMASHLSRSRERIRSS